MFSSRGLFQGLACPNKESCNRPHCLFSHAKDIPPPPSLSIPVDTPKANSSIIKPSIASTSAIKTVSVKRPIAHSPVPGSGVEVRNGSSSGEPPRKLQKLASLQKQAVPNTSYTSTGVPILKVNAAQSQIAVPVRQAMVKNLYDHFVILYEAIIPTNPTLAADHALRQEEEVYKKSTKFTYRNAVISSISTLKRRPKPNSHSHPSVGTESEIAAREESRKSLESLRLTRNHLSQLKLSEADMRKWGYILDMPEGPGGDKPNEVGYTMKCERCSQPYMVKPKEQAEGCEYHYGKQFTHKVNGEKLRIYTCCSRPTSDGGGCVRGPHVFYESDPVVLHSRHAFSFTRPPAASGLADTALDVAAMDCEMVYTTGGMRCARVSVVDGTGAEVFDELVRMDDGVEIIDYITRFSGITPETHSKAVLPLTSIRKSLDALINSNTVLIGHALDNDLKTLRMLHQQCVDTAMLFPHKAGVPYRRALKDLVREHLGKFIQAGGGTVGHSSVEDSIATLDLVRWYVLNKLRSQKAQPGNIQGPDGGGKVTPNTIVS